MFSQPLMNSNYVLRPLVDNYPLLFYFCLSFGFISLVTLILMSNIKTYKFSDSLYFGLVIVALVIIDMLTYELPMFICYAILLSYMQFKIPRLGRNPQIVSGVFIFAFMFIEAVSHSDKLVVTEFAGKSLGLILIAWLVAQLNKSLANMAKIKLNNQYLLGLLDEERKKIHKYHGELVDSHKRDNLTGLFNLTGFLQELNKHLNAKDQQPYHVICVDIRDFQTFNINEGIDVGDQMLIQIARKLQENLPNHANIARYDGDQFAIGLPGNQSLLKYSIERVNSVIKSVRAKDGSLKYCLGTASYPEEADGVAGLIRLAEKRLTIEQRNFHHKEEERRRQMEKLSAIGQLAAGLAHEIRNPLASIRGFVQLAASESNVIKRWERIILPEIDRINDLLRQFLNLSKANPAQFTHFSLNQLISDVLTLLRPKAVMMGHEVVVNSPAKPVKIEADAEQIKQVMINLVKNAMEALDDNGSIEVAWKEINGRVSLKVKDNGDGIQPEHLNQIFDPFFTTKDEGTGMGLSICHRIVLEHGGRIHVSSQSKLGTVFNIQLPLLQSKDSDMVVIYPESSPQELARQEHDLYLAPIAKSAIK